MPDVLSPRPLLKTLVKGEAHFGFWNLISRGLGALSSVFIISALSLYEYGAFQLLMANYGFLAVFIGMAGGGSAVSNDILRAAGEKKAAYAKGLFFQASRLQLAAGTLLWAGTFFGAPLLSFRFGPEFITVIRITSFLFLHEALAAVMRPVLKMGLAFGALANRSALAKGVQLCLLVASYMLGNLGLQTVLGAYVLSAFVATLSWLPAFLRAWRPWRGIEPLKGRLLRPIFFSYGKWDLLQTPISRLASFVQPWLTKLVISTEAVAIFGFADKIIGLVKDFLPANTLSALAPLTVHEGARARRLLTYGTKYLFFLSLAMALAAVLGAPPLVRFFFPRYSVALPFFYLMVLNIPLAALGVLPTIFLVVLRRQRFLFFERFVKESVVLVFLAVLVPLFGIWGLALETVLAPLVFGAVIYFYLWRTASGLRLEPNELFTFGPRDAEFLKILIAGSRRFVKRKFARPFGGDE